MDDGHKRKTTKRHETHEKEDNENLPDNIARANDRDCSMHFDRFLFFVCFVSFVV